MLAYFDPHKEVTVQVDASKNGLGATIMQEGRPGAYASKLLNSTEQNYAQIEKELYAVLFGCRRFHVYIYIYMEDTSPWSQTTSHLKAYYASH